MPKPARLALLAVVSGLAAAAFTTDLTGLRAEFESPLQFSINQQRHRSGERVYAREPVRVGRVEGFFGRLLQFDFKEEAPRPRVAAAPELQRAVCKRQCDGAQLVLGFLPSKSKQKEAEAMCAAAGDGAKTELVLEKFVPGAGFDVSAPVQTASAGPLLEGRAALDTNPALGEARPAPAVSTTGPCPASASRHSFMIVPILHDATLRNGDVVATRDGFKVFVGGGRPPFEDRDFVALDSRKRVSADLRKLKVADR